MLALTVCSSQRLIFTELLLGVSPSDATFLVSTCLQFIQHICTRHDSCVTIYLHVSRRNRVEEHDQRLPLSLWYPSTAASWLEIIPRLFPVAFADGVWCCWLVDGQAGLSSTSDRFRQTPTDGKNSTASDPKQQPNRVGRRVQMSASVCSRSCGSTKRNRQPVRQISLLFPQLQQRACTGPHRSMHRLSSAAAVAVAVAGRLSHHNNADDPFLLATGTPNAVVSATPASSRGLPVDSDGPRVGLCHL